MNHIIASIFLVISLFPFILFASGPGEAGGGGTMVSLPTQHSKKQLLDLYIFQKQHPEISFPNSERGESLPQTKNLYWLHLDRLTNSELSIIQIALKKLDIWGPRPPSFIQALRDALIHAPIFYTDYRITTHDQNLWIPDDLKTSELLESMTTIAYHAKDWGILVSKNDFESLDQLNQVALLIHEALRHVQIFYGLQISNQTLEILTASLALGIKSFPDIVTGELKTIYDLDRGRTSEQIINNIKGIQNDACKLVVNLQKNAQKVFEPYAKQLCFNPSIDYQFSNQEKEKLEKALFSSIDGSISQAILQKNVLSIHKSSERAFWGHKISQLMELRSNLYIALFEFNYNSDELQDSLRKLQDSTLTLQHFAIDAALKGQSFALSIKLSQLMDNLIEEGVLIKSSDND